MSSMPLLMRKRYCVFCVWLMTRFGKVIRPSPSSANSQPKIALTCGASALPSISTLMPEEMM